MSMQNWYLVICVGALILVMLLPRIIQMVQWLRERKILARTPKICPEAYQLPIKKGDVVLVCLPKGIKIIHRFIGSKENFLIEWGNMMLAGWKDTRTKPPWWTNEMTLGPECGETIRIVALKGKRIVITTNVVMRYGKTNLDHWHVSPNDVSGMESIWQTIADEMEKTGGEMK
jgi:hypothetical protein